MGGGEAEKDILDHMITGSIAWSLSFQRSKISVQNVKRGIKESLNHNSNTSVKKLKFTKSESNTFYAPNENLIPQNKSEEWKTSEHFEEFSQLATKHQLLMTDNDELICFIPSLEHSKSVISEHGDKSLRDCLTLHFNHKKNQIKKGENNSGKKRKTEGTWIFTGSKYSPFENGADCPLGITPYANDKSQTAKDLENELKKHLKKVVGVFKKPLYDLCLRQKAIIEETSRSTLATVGLSLAAGRDYYSSSHVDDDMVFTFAGSFSTQAGKVGNSFIFPDFKAKLTFPNDSNVVTLFCFNPRFVHCAEKVQMKTGHSYLFSLYTKATTYSQAVVLAHEKPETEAIGMAGTPSQSFGSDPEDREDNEPGSYTSREDPTYEDLHMQDVSDDELPLSRRLEKRRKSNTKENCLDKQIDTVEFKSSK